MRRYRCEAKHRGKFVLTVYASSLEEAMAKLENGQEDDFLVVEPHDLDVLFETISEEPT